VVARCVRHRRLVVFLPFSVSLLGARAGVSGTRPRPARSHCVPVRTSV